MESRTEERAVLVESRRAPAAQVSEFMGRAAYAIRSPLNIILGYNELLGQLLAALGDDSQRPYLDSIRRAGQHIQETIKLILDFSQVEDGSFRLRPERIDLAMLVQRLVQDYRVLANAKNLGLICEIAQPEAAVHCDRYCLTNALSNLIDNAIKFTDKGGAVVKVCRDPRARLCIEVRDTGVGFDPEELIGAIDFARNGNERRYERAGLGLTLARKYLDLMGVSLSLASSPGKGSVFTIGFPALLEAGREPQLADGASPPPPWQPSPEPDHQEAEPGAARAMILVVEDQPDQALFMRALLQSQYRVVMAASGDEAIARLEETGERVGLVVMDVSLAAGEDGLKVTRRLRADRRWEDLPIVVTTAYGFEEDRERALAAGCTAYVAKPIDAAELLATIGRLLG
jgi:CheY-like chemotaxis protein